MSAASGSITMITQACGAPFWVMRRRPRAKRAVWKTALVDKHTTVVSALDAVDGRSFAVAVAGRVLGQILVGGCPAGEIPFPAALRSDWSRRAGDAARLREVTAAYVTKPVAADVLERWASAAATIPEAVLDESLRICTDVSFADRLAAIRVPTLVVAGLHDQIFSPDVLRHGMQAAIRGARLVVVDSNHEIPIEAPRALAGLISAFVAGFALSAGDA